MTKAKKIGIILVLVGICLPTATLPFITEFRPHPELCLTSNFFSNLGNMVVTFGIKQMNVVASDMAAAYMPVITIPYRYLFALGVIMMCTGLGVIVVSHPTKKG
jgi:hypothetical protein